MHPRWAVAPSLDLWYLARYAYMTDLDTVEVRKQHMFAAEGHDLKSLLFNFLDECLYIFGTELLVCR